LASVLSSAAAVLTLSRNALIFSLLALGASFIFCAFAGKKTRLFRILSVAGIAIFIIAALIFREKIASLLSKLLEQGLSDNGRFELWGIGIENFLSNPIFGTGFFGYGETETVIAASFLPTMAHNTVIELLSAMGILGLISYAFYRAVSLKPFIIRPNADKTMLLFPIIIALGMSLVDNFVFYFYTMFYYTVALALAQRLADEEKT
jgi:O-antigen ligase